LDLGLLFSYWVATSPIWDFRVGRWRSTSDF